MPAAGGLYAEGYIHAKMENLGGTVRTGRDRVVQVRRRLIARLGGAAVVAGAVLGGIAPAGAVAPKSGLAAASMLRIAILSPRDGASYQRGSRIVARFRCTEGGITAPIVSCRGTVPRGHAVNTRSGGTKSFTVTATDTSGNSVTETVRYGVWAYVNPLRAVGGLRASRIDMGVDYSGSGPILAIGKAKVITARYVPGPEGCWGKTCAPAPGGWVVYRLLDGPFAGKYVYAVENITLRVKAGQLVRPGQVIAMLHPRSPNLEIGWAAGRDAETLAVLRHHQCACTDPGGWSSIEGRNFNRFLVWLGAPSGYVQETPPQKMPHGWPALPRRT